MKTYTTSFAMGKPYGNVTLVNRGTDLEYREGSYTFFHGVVTFYSEPTFATFSFVYLGRTYTLSLSELEMPLSDRQLIRNAGKFGRKVVASLITD